MKIENYNIRDFNLVVEKDFKESIADFAKVPHDDVQVLSVKQGSVIIDFKVNFKFAYGTGGDDTSTTDDEVERFSSSSSSELKESTEGVDANNTNKGKYPPHLTINRSQEAFTNSLRVEQPSVIFKNAKTWIMQNSKLSLLALEDLQEISIQAWRNDIDSAFINVTVTDIRDGDNSTHDIHIYEAHHHQENATKTPSFTDRLEKFYEANEANIQKVGFAAAAALFLLLVYCVWKRLRRRAVTRAQRSSK